MIGGRWWNGATRRIFRWIDKRLAERNLAFVRCADRGKGYLDANGIITGASAAGIQVNDYIDKLWPGHMQWAQKFLDVLIEVAELRSARNGLVVCEIGAGSGRHLELLMKQLPIIRYEVYETNPEWRDLLARDPRVVALTPTGETLGHTASQSVDLFQAHAVLTYLPFLTGLSYLEEATRTLKEGGVLAFDIYTEKSMSETAVARWLSTVDRWPAMLPRQFVIDFLAARDCRLLAGDIVGLGSHDSIYFVFRKERA